jgi:hypothetical protein
MTYNYTWANPEQTSLIREDENGKTAHIPTDPANRDYAEFLESGATAGDYVPPPPSTDPNYIGFSDALLVSAAYGVIRTTAKTSLAVNVVATELLALLGDAKAGRAIDVAIQASLDELNLEVPLTQANRDELNSLFAAFYLPYTLA